MLRARPTRTALSAECRRPLRSRGDYLLWFIPAMALQFGLVAMGAALRGTGNFKPGMVVQRATVVINIVLAPVLIFGWGTGVALGVGGAAIATLIADGHRHRLDDVVFPAGECVPEVLGGSGEAALPALGKPAENRPASGRRVRPDDRLSDHRLRREPPLRRQRAGGLRDRHARRPGVLHAGRGARLRGGACGRTEFRRAAAPIVCVQTFYVAAGMAVGVMACVRWRRSCSSRPRSMVRSSRPIAAVIAVGEEYLRIVSWSFVVPRAIIFVASSMFQAMGNTLPSLISSFARIVAVSIPVLLLAQTPDFSCGGCG